MSRRGPRFVPIEDAPGPGLSPRARELSALLVLGACLYLLLALATFSQRPPEGEIPRGNFVNLGGSVGYQLADAIVFVLGWGGWALCLLGVVFGLSMFAGRKVERPTLKALGAVVFVAMLALLFAGSGGTDSVTRLAPYGAGGRFGANLAPKLDLAFGSSGRILLVLFGALVSLLLATEWMFSEMLDKAFRQLEQAWRRLISPRPALAVAGSGDDDVFEDEAEPASLTGQRLERSVPKIVGRRPWLARVPLLGGMLGGARLGSDQAETDVPSEPVSGGVRAGESSADATLSDAIGGEIVCASESGTELAGLAAPETEPAVAETDGAPGSDGSGLSPEADGEAIEEVEDLGEVETLTPAPSRSKARKVGRVARAKKPRKRRRARRPAQPELPFAEPYPFPPLDLFREPAPSPESESETELAANKAAIERRLASFKIDASVVSASVGPAVTQYELELAEGIKLSKLTSYEADLAAALRAVSVRVVAPIPGKGTVGVEVPNSIRQIVVMRELLEEFGSVGEMAIPLMLGRDVAGMPIVEDLAKMPHLLIAGTTGSGKSVCINSILLSILMLRTPQQVRLILVDPKMVELQTYRQVPHLACSVVTNMKKAPGVLEWAVGEMERRYALLSSVGVNHIRGYNKLGKDEIDKRIGREIDTVDAYLPYQVLVIDELADLMAVAQKEVEESIQRLAQKSRAVGLHVILATQRPSSDVITGIIKANLPVQIAFKVNRKIDSRVILDSNGAEKLLGHGDMLFVPPSSHQLVRAQGTFVSEDEIHAVVNYLEANGPKPSFIPDLIQTDTSKRKSPKDKDDLFGDAVEVILGQQRGSATLMQRALSIGYTRATRLLEMMEADGIVGPFCGSKSREVLLTLEEYQAREAAIEAELDALEEASEEDGEEYLEDGEEAEEGEWEEESDETEDENAAEELAADADDYAEECEEEDDDGEDDEEVDDEEVHDEEVHDEEEVEEEGVDDGEVEDEDDESPG